MDASSVKNYGHSARVTMELHLGDGCIVPIKQMGPDFIILSNPRNYAPTSAKVFMRIDNSESTWPVHLVDGIRAGQPRTRIDSVADES